jgi:hypothetical protein
VKAKFRWSDNIFNGLLICWPIHYKKLFNLWYNHFVAD